MDEDEVSDTDLLFVECVEPENVETGGRDALGVEVEVGNRDRGPIVDTADSNAELGLRESCVRLTFFAMASAL